MIIKFAFEYGSDFSCIWGVNKDSVDKFGGYLIEHEWLGISKELDLKMQELCVEFQSSLNWDYPPDPSPWTEEHWLDFKKKARQAYDDLVKELGDEYKVIYGVI